MKTLLHICCAPCSVECIGTLREEGIEPVGFWYNPNIHPFTEYRSRKEALIEYAGSIDLEQVLHDEYGLRRFVHSVSDDIDGRCAFCYRIRLEAAARYAVQNGFDSFTTTLLISPYQKHEAIRNTAEAICGPVRAYIPVSGFSSPFPGRTEASPQPRAVHAEILRLHLQ